jgi:sugar lactone lactonase YvrE
MGGLRASALRAAAVLALLASLACGGMALAGGRERLDITVFARVPAPGQPEPIAIGPDHRIYVGTNQQLHGDRDVPSKIFAYTLGGKLVRSYVIKGQPLAGEHGIQGLAFDGRGRLFALDRSDDPRVLVIDPKTGRQRTYAHFRDVPPCPATGGGEDCSATISDRAAEPDYAAFGPGGALYVTDIEQALVWRVPRGGGRPSVWLTDSRFESPFGPNGVQFMEGGRQLLLAVTGTRPDGPEAGAGALFEIPLQGRRGRAGEPEALWTSRPFDGPDGFAIARSGRIYLALAGTSQIALLSPSGEEINRVPPNPVANQQEEIPVDSPASVAFLGRRALVTNHSALAGNPESWAILDVWAGERGLPLHKPVIHPRR